MASKHASGIKVKRILQFALGKDAEWVDSAVCVAWFRSIRITRSILFF